MWLSLWKYWYSPNCTDRGWKIGEMKEVGIAIDGD